MRERIGKRLKALSADDERGSAKKAACTSDLTKGSRYTGKLKKSSAHSCKTTTDGIPVHIAKRLESFRNRFKALRGDKYPSSAEKGSASADLA